MPELEGKLCAGVGVAKESEVLGLGWAGKKFSDFYLENFEGPVTVLLAQKIFGVFGLAGSIVFVWVRFCKYGYKNCFLG